MSKRITILGAGESGMGAARLAKSIGFSVFVSDSKEISISAKKILDELGIDYEENGHTYRIINTTEIIKSPGIPPDIEMLQEARKSEIPIIDELEFAGRYSKARKILVTGTNGKTTTTRLIEQILLACRVDAKAVGNIGDSFSSELLKSDRDVFVIESSSFQLDGMKSFKADVGILLNITSDHLNRYGDLSNYIKSKNHISELITDEGLFIYNSDDALISKSSDQLKSKGFSLTEISSAFKSGSTLVFEGDVEFESSKFILKGDHNRMNIMAAVMACFELECEPDCIREAIEIFKPVEHRLEYIDTINTVDFVNDSKATNVDAVQFALDSFDSPLVWIAGGVDKGNDYPSLLPQIKGKVHALVCLGIDNQSLKNAFEGNIGKLIETDSMQVAVKNALDYANANDTVLLSPACASFDLFENYQDRGDQFRKAVKELKLEIERGEHA